jgi:methylenetetrahydrofolate dehydrogenase (NADP+)/methenyltetrahydrofolate cyclohydrolase
MTAKILRGKDTAEKIDEQTAVKVKALAEKGVTPLLGLIRVGKNESDLAYERGIRKKFDKLGMKVFVMELEEDTTTQDIIRVLNVTNNNNDISGIMIFRPLPESIDESMLARAISSAKDVDGMSPVNAAKVYSGDSTGFAPCTAEAAIDILKYNDIETKGREAVVVGRSMVIGKPAAMMLLHGDATVTMAHSKTPDLAGTVSRADIVVAAAGRAGLITEDMIKDGAAVIDVGINVTEDGKIKGDVAEGAEGKASAITPVPGGVGSVTTSVLAAHVARAAEYNLGKKNNFTKAPAKVVENIPKKSKKVE